VCISGCAPEPSHNVFDLAPGKRPVTHSLATLAALDLKNLEGCTWIKHSLGSSFRLRWRW
jgi:hypothetical protein